MWAPRVFTRRQFLRDAAIVGAAIAAGPSLAACRDSSDGDDLDAITSVAIHPAIGIARVGNSEDSFYFGPEVPGAIPRPTDGFKDAQGAIARQAARFRLYGFDRRGRVVRELSAADGAIMWSVSVANKKAFWYDYDVAFDLPIARSVARRNAQVTGSDRDALVVAPGVVSIAGDEREPVAIDGGTFMDETVPLGELMVDGDGRLVFVAASGSGYSPTSAPLTTFSDNDGWVDDTCDGPVQATIRLGDRTLEAAPAWVVSTPPNYGPAMAAGFVTAYDSARAAWDEATPPGPVSFGAEILPLFTRIVDMQWVNFGFLESNGWGSAGDFLDAARLEQLADPTDANAAFRREIFEQFRDPSYATEEPDDIPQIYGDGVAIPASSAYQWLAVTPIQYRALERWADGDFVDDRDEVTPVDRLDDLPVAGRPAALDRAALDSCLGGAYHPGIELPWSLRVPTMWAEPGRLLMRTDEADLTDYGDELTPETVLSDDGPLAGSGPGDLTRWLGTPWQTDAGSCRSGYEPDVSPVLPTFWPARIPNQVLRQAEYETVLDAALPLEERQAAFGTRHDWERFVAGPGRTETLTGMLAGWWKLGLVEERPGPDGDDFPAVMKVESDVGFTEEPAVAYGPTYDPLPEFQDVP